MAKRYKPNQARAKRKFAATANKSHIKNNVPAPMRGGYRL